MENLFNTIFPPECIFCGKYGKMVCYGCLHRCEIVEYGFCIVCGGLAVDGETHYQCRMEGIPLGLFSSFKYGGLVRECIRKSKYGAKEFAALKELSKEGAKYAWKSGLDFDDFIAVPIPLSRAKEKSRGFNQSLLISNEVSRVFKIESDPSVLTRKKDTKAQFRLSKEERKTNISGAFSTSSVVKGKKILLVDDICTSGSTLLEAARMLYKSGAEEIRCYTLARKM